MGIHPTAYIHADADVHPTCELGPHVVIDGAVRIGANTKIGPAAVILGNTEIGTGCSIHSHCVIGDVPQDHKYTGATTYCRIGNDCVVREGATIHRACIRDAATVVGDGCYLMTNSHVGHDCVLEEEVTLVSGALLGGHVHVGRKAIISGNTGVHQFVRIGELAMVGGVAKIVQDVPPYMMTDRDGAVVGVNAIGLMRAGLSIVERQEIKELYKLLYRSGMSLERCIEMVKTVAVTDAGRRLVEFFTHGSRRGVRRVRRERRVVA